MTPTTQAQRPPRVDFGGQISVKARNRSVNDTGLVRNLSEGGVLFYSTRKYSPGTELLLYLPIELGSRKSLCLVSGTIVRVQAPQHVESVQGYGVRFDPDLSKSSRQLLRDFVTMKQTGSAPEISKITRRISKHRD